MERKWLALLISGSLLTGAGGTFVGLKLTEDKQSPIISSQTTQDKNHVSPDLTKISQAYDLIMKSYVQKVSEKQLVQGAIKGMVSTLNDPYSVYMDAQTANKFNESLGSSFQGIGAEVSNQDGKIVIVSPYKDSPAEKAGLKPKDEILTIDGESIKGLDIYDVTSKIRGKKGTAVTITIQRSNSHTPISFRIKREEIPLQTVFSSIKTENNKKIGYIQVTQFSENTGKDFKKQLLDLESKGISGLLIDVRGNPGGLLTSVEEVLNNFVTKNNPYFLIEQRNGEKVPFHSKLNKDKTYPVKVLIDSGSASASEILAGALQEAEGDTLIGETSFGKGTVQQAVSLGDGSTIKLTMFKWLTPDGHWIHGKGIKPNIEVKQPEYFHINPLQIKNTLTADQTNTQIKIAQEMLIGLGYGPGRDDGYFSSQTKVSVAAFQQQAHLPVTGNIDKKTAFALQDAVTEEMKNPKNDLQLQVALRLFK